MKPLVFILGAFFIASQTSLAVARSFQSHSKIVGGLVTDIKTVPYQASVQVELKNGSLLHFCGASILNSEWLLSAAHCFMGSNKTYYTRVGSTLRYQGGQLIKINETYAHKDYNAWTSQNDIALFKLETPITISKAKRTSVIALPEQGTPVVVNSSALVSGWGDTEDERDRDERDLLRSVKVPIIELEKCQQQYLNQTRNADDNMICAGYLGVGQKDSCQGDSGGPLVNDQGVQIGIVSWGKGCALASYPGVYTKVSSFRNWIKEISGL